MQSLVTDPPEIVLFPYYLLLYSSKISIVVMTDFCPRQMISIAMFFLELCAST